MSRNQFEFEEDFVGAHFDGADKIFTSTGVWFLEGTGTPTCSILNGATGAPGILRLTTSGSTNDSARIRHEGAAALGSELVEVGFRFRVPTLTTLTFELGVSEDFTFPGSNDARYVALDTNTDNNLRSVAQNSSIDITNTALAVAANTWRTVRMRKSGFGVLAQTIVEDAAGVVSGVFNHTVSGNLYGATVAFLTAQIVTGTGSARSLDLDRVFFKTGALAR